jgi:uncharacterized protein (UPF0264 family)
MEGGATLLDVKEPRLGSLGRARDRTIRLIFERVAERLPVSAAMGELLQTPQSPPLTGLAYAKWGLSGYLHKDWQEALREARSELKQHNLRCEPVVVAYADWERALSPRPNLICEFACGDGFAALLVDTWKKDGTTLLDWVGVEELSRMALQCRAAGVKLALAGSLGPKEIVELRAIQPEWFAVRGAVCRQGKRGGSIDLHAVRCMANLATCAPQDVLA